MLFFLDPAHLGHPGYTTMLLLLSDGLDLHNVC